MIVGYRRIKINYEKGEYNNGVELSGPMADFTLPW
jgi:hypothetical protein